MHACVHGVGNIQRILCRVYACMCAWCGQYTAHIMSCICMHVCMVWAIYSAYYVVYMHTCVHGVGNIQRILCRVYAYMCAWCGQYTAHIMSCICIHVCMVWAIYSAYY